MFFTNSSVLRKQILLHYRRFALATLLWKLKINDGSFFLCKICTEKQNNQAAVCVCYFLLPGRVYSVYYIHYNIHMRCFTHVCLLDCSIVHLLHRFFQSNSRRRPLSGRLFTPQEIFTLVLPGKLPRICSRSSFVRRKIKKTHSIVHNYENCFFCADSRTG